LTFHNVLAASYLIQLRGAHYHLFWPEAAANGKLQCSMGGSPQ